MTREWVDDMKPRPRRGPDTRDKRWVMRCDARSPYGARCRTEGEPSHDQPSLTEYAAAGWFIAEVHGDICPDCLAKGVKPTAKPHSLMEASR